MNALRSGIGRREAVVDARKRLSEARAGADELPMPDGRSQRPRDETRRRAAPSVVTALGRFLASGWH